MACVKSSVTGKADPIVYEKAPALVDAEAGSFGHGVR